MRSGLWTLLSPILQSDVANLPSSPAWAKIGQRLSLFRSNDLERKAKLWRH